MAFGTSAPPASQKQVQYLLSLVQKAGHEGFRDARYPLGLTQRQSSGKFSKAEASALIDRLLADPTGAGGGPAAGDDTGSLFAAGAPLSGAQLSAAERLDNERAEMLRGIPAGLLAAELERRGWHVTPPA
jgi:hypothetical protein